MEEERVFYVYRHLRNDTGLPFYIGKGKRKPDQLSYRKAYQRAYTKQGHNMFWDRIVNKVGRTVEILVDDLTHGEAVQKEMEFIALYKRHDDGGILCNITIGGEGMDGATHTEKERENISIRCHKRRKGKALSAEWKEKIRLSMIEARKKKKWTSKSTPETRERERLKKEKKKEIAELAKIKSVPKKKEEESKTQKKPGPLGFQVICLDTGFVFDSSKEAAIAMFDGNHKSIGNSIYKRCKKELKNPYLGFSFSFV